MKENLKALDGIRGLTAFYVFVHHARFSLSQPYFKGLASHPEKYEWYDKLLVYVFGLFKYGHEAVIVFFVLSGFVIHLKQGAPDFSFPTFSTINYLKKRTVRIYPTLLTSFAIYVIVDYLISLVTGDNLMLLLSKYHLSNFLYNLFLIPEAPIWGYNFPMWSLKHEWFFYLLYPILLWLSNKSFFFPLIITTLLFVSYALGLRIPYIGAAAYTLQVWCLGSILAYFYKNSGSKLINYFPYLLLIIIVYFFIDRENANTYPLLDLTFGLIVTGLLSVVILSKISFINKILNRFAWLGSFSFSLYLLHLPLINLFKVIVLNIQHVTELPFHQWYILASIFIILPVTYLIYYFTERKAIIYKRKIISS